MLPGVSQLCSFDSSGDDGDAHRLTGSSAGASFAKGDHQSSCGASLDRIKAAVRGYVGDELDWDLQLSLRKEDAPPLGLGIVGHLGWSSWLMQKQMPKDPDDLVLHPMQVPDNAERIEYRYVRDWDSTTLGQTRDGRYIVVTNEAEEPDLAYIDTDALQAAAS